MKKWTTAFTAFLNNTGASSPTLTITASNITLANSLETYTLTNYPDKSIQQIVSELNANLSHFDVYVNADIGSEYISTSSLFSAGIDYLIPGSPLVCKYGGLIIKPEEQSIIQLKPPKENNNLVSWHARINKGKFVSKFSNTSFTNYPGVDANAIYEFSIPEYDYQEWSPTYGQPYKDVAGEVPLINGYNSNLNSTVIKVANTPIYYKNKNISISIKGIRQPNSIIKFIDANNGLIYLNQQFGNKVDLTVDYTYEEKDYIYDAVDLNASIAHNPLVVDTFIAFYVKPSRANGALISGGKAIFHEILNTESSAKVKVARVIPETANTNNPKYEPVIYLGSLNVRQGMFYDDFSLIDTRSRGGGLKENKDSQWAESQSFLDIGNIEGKEIPGVGAIVVNLNENEYSIDTLSKDEIEYRASRDVSMGILPIFDYIPSTGYIDYDTGLTISGNGLFIEFAEYEDSYTLHKMSKTGNGYYYSRTFGPTELFSLRIRKPYTEYTGNPVPNDKIFSNFLGDWEGDTGQILTITAGDFTYSNFKNYDSYAEIEHSGLTINSIYFPDYYIKMRVKIESGSSYWNLYSHPQSTGYELVGIEYPKMIPKVTDANNSLLTPIYGGTAILAPQSSLNSKFSLSNPGLDMQVFGIYSPVTPDSGAFYFATEDSSLHYMKTHMIDVVSGGTGIGLWSIGYSCEPYQKFTPSWIPYETTMDLISGDWYDICNRYREWGQRTWLKDIPHIHDFDHKAHKYPSWIKDYMFHIRYAGYNPSIAWDTIRTGWDKWDHLAHDANRVREYIECTGVMLWQIQGWHYNEFDTLWPDYDPVFPSIRKARTFFETGTNDLIKYYPYTIGLVSPASTYILNNHYTGYYPKLENGAARASTFFDLLQNQTVPGFMYGMSVGPRFLYDIADDRWIEKLIGYETAGAYRDFWGTISPYSDYSDYIKHKGSLYHNSLAQTDRERIFKGRYKEALGDWPMLNSEGFDERYVGIYPLFGQSIGIPSYDVYFANQYWATGFTYPLPTLKTIYGNYFYTTPIAPAFGSQNSTGTAQIVIKDIERNIHYGSMTAANYAFTGLSHVEIAMNSGSTGPYIEVMDFLKQLMLNHYNVVDYIYGGKRLRPFDPVNESLNLIYAGTSGAWWSMWEPTGTSIGLVITNANTGYSAATTISIPYYNYPELSDKTGFFETTTGQDTWITGYTHTGTWQYNLTMSPASIRVYEFR